LVVLSLVLLTSLSAQMIYGQWRCRDYDWSLELAEDGQYVSEYPGGSSAGMYFMDGYLLTFQDAYTAEVATYTFSFAGDVMQFTDQMGTSYLFIRKGSPAENLPADVFIEDPSSTSPALAEKNHFVLRSEHVKAGIDILELTVGEQVTEVEADRLLDAWLRDFDEDPEAVFADLDGLTVTRDKLASITDPWEVAMLRATLVGAFHNEALTTPADEWHEFLQVMFNHVKVVAFDKVNLLAFTDKDLDAFLDYVAFTMALNTGSELSWSTSQRDSIGREIATGFSKLSLEEKQLMCGIDVISKYVTYTWNQASEYERGRFASQMVETPAEDFDYSKYTPSSPSSTSSGITDMATYNMLQNSIMDAHNSALNALSAINDPPYYYDMTTY